MKEMSLGLAEALRMTLQAISPLPAESVSLVESVDRVAASDLYALVDSPSTDVSLKDGYAVLSRDIDHATPENPVRLPLIGSIAAGSATEIQIRPGTAVRVLSGARIPSGADAVVAEEFVKRPDGNLQDVLVETFAEPGRNILPRASDVALRECILRSGQPISPAMAGLLAAAGHSAIPVFRNPVVGIIGTGDEIVEAGEPAAEGKLYASNIVTVAGWCKKYNMEPHMIVSRDDPDAILSALKTVSDETDAVITSGGAWTGDHDVVARVLKEIGWKQVFHRIRIGPGKAVGFGMLHKKPVFILPGGPPSNLMAFLQIALPGLLALSGHKEQGLPVINARLASELKEGDPAWTDFFFGIVESTEGLPIFHPMKKRTRLSLIAEATAIASIPEGEDSLPEGSVITIQLLKQTVGGC